MKRLSIQLLDNLKARLDGLRATGTTAAGLIRHLLTQHFKPPGGKNGTGQARWLKRSGV